MRASGRFLIPVLCSLALVLGGCSGMKSFFGGAPEKPKASAQIKTTPPAPRAPRTPAPPLTTVDTTAAILNPPPAAPAPQPAPMNRALASMDGKTRVALLLPLSGKNAALGQAMANAAQMAVFELAGNNFELMPRDTGSGGESAAKAAEDAIGSGAQLVLGPLFAADVAAVKPVVQSSGLNMLALSSDVSLATPGAYVMGFSPSSLVDRIVAFAARRNLYRFAAILPNNPYGKLVRQAFLAEVARRRGEVMTIETYGSASDMDRAVKNVMAKAEGVDALFIPAGGAELTQIAGLLSANGFEHSRIRLLGSGLWDEAPVSKIPVLSGGWYAAAEPEAREAFMRNYAAAYGEAPPRLATLAYDATALAVILAKRGQAYDRASLSNPSGFSGLDGIFRLTGQGTAERGLAVREVRPDGVTVIDPAPSTFMGL